MITAHATCIPFLGPVLCACGCGEPAPIAKKTDSSNGRVEGQPQKFVKGHNARLKRPTISPTDYVLSKTTIADNGCWIWIGLLDEKGYGRATRKTGPILAHRYSYLAFVGEIPRGLELDHLCCVIQCVNPDHLEPVTRDENMRRRAERQTHCKRGHELPPYKNGRRRCKTCHNAGEQRRRKARA